MLLEEYDEKAEREYLRKEAIEEGIEQGMILGSFGILASLVDDGTLSVEQAAKRAEDKQEEFRMYHTRGNKIIYELEYKDVIAVREWLMDTLMLFCEKPIIKKNGKIGPKTVWANYRKADRIRIMQIIAKNYPNIKIMSYSNIHSDEN